MRFTLILMLFLTSCSNIDDYINYNPIYDEIQRIRHFNKCKQLIFNKLEDEGEKPWEIDNQGKHQFDKGLYIEITGNLYVNMGLNRYKVPYKVWYEYETGQYTLKWYNIFNIKNHEKENY